MNLLEKENIFLLEFMVDRVCIDIMGSWDSKVLNAETCVGFTFLKHGPFYVGDEDFLPTKKWVVNGCSGCGNVKNGKSILFSLTPDMVEEARNKFVVNLEVLKRMPGFKPETVTLGATVVPLMELFGQILEKVVRGTVPITKTLKETFVVKDNNGEKIGKIGAYVRLSCFGKVIVTKFQMNYEAESVNFSAKEGKCLYKYNRKDNCNNFRTDVCCPGYPCLPCCPAVQAAMKDRDRKNSDALDGRGGEGGEGRISGGGNRNANSDGKKSSGKGNKKGSDGNNKDGNGGGGVIGNNVKGGNKGTSGGKDKGKTLNDEGGEGRNSDDSKTSNDQKNKKRKNRPDVPFIGGPASGSGKRECPPPCDPCNPCNPCLPYPPCCCERR